MKVKYTQSTFVHEISVGHLSTARLFVIDNLPDELTVVDSFRDLGFRPTWRVPNPSTQERQEKVLFLLRKKT